MDVCSFGEGGSEENFESHQELQTKDILNVVSVVKCHSVTLMDAFLMKTLKGADLILGWQLSNTHMVVVRLQEQAATCLLDMAIGQTQSGFCTCGEHAVETGVMPPMSPGVVVQLSCVPN